MLLTTKIGKDLKYAINKQKLHSIALLSTAMILMLPNLVGASQYAYIPNQDSNNVSVINLTTNIVEHRVDVGAAPYGVAVTQNGTKVYVTELNDFGVPAINTATNNLLLHQLCFDILKYFTYYNFFILSN
jgi:YVTN family beta-propeller protein